MRSRVPKASKGVRERGRKGVRESPARKLYVIGRVLWSVPCRIPGCWYSICEPLCAWISGFCKFSCCVLGPYVSNHPFSSSFAGFLKFHLIIKKLTRTKVFGKHIYIYTSIFINYMYSLIYTHILILVHMSIHICVYAHI